MKSRTGISYENTTVDEWKPKSNKTRPIIRYLFNKIRRNAQYEFLRNRWVTDKLIVATLNRMNENGTLITVGKFNGCMISPMYGFSCEMTTNNPCGVFQMKFGNNYYYYITQPGNTIQPFSMNKLWAETMEKECNDILNQFLETPPGIAPVPLLEPTIQSTRSTVTESPRHSPAVKTCRKRKRDKVTTATLHLSKKVAKSCDIISPDIHEKDNEAKTANVYSGSKVYESIKCKAVLMAKQFFGVSW